MKTLRQIFNDTPLDRLTKGALRTVLLSFIPNSMDKPVRLRIDQAAGRVTFWYDGKPVVDSTFEGILEYVNGPEVERIDPEPGPGAPAGPAGLAGQANLLPDGCPGEKSGADHGAPGAPTGGI